jgi:hypothetical protein
MEEEKPSNMLRAPVVMVMIATRMVQIDLAAPSARILTLHRMMQTTTASVVWG